MRTKRLACAVVATLIVAWALAFGQGECTREYHGDLVLTGDQSLVITGGTLCVHGNIILRDNARLTITDSTLLISGLRESVWEDHARIEVNDTARLLMMNVRVEVVGRRLSSIGTVAHGTAEVEVSGASAPSWVRLCANAHGASVVRVVDTALWTTYVGDRGTLEVINSSIEWAYIEFSSAWRVEVADLRQGYYANWELLRGTGVSISMRLRNSRVGGGWSVNVRGHARVTILRSVNIGMLLDLASMPERIQDMGTGFHSNWSLWTESTAAVGNVTLVNTSVAWWGITLRNFRQKLTLVNSGPTNLIVLDSSVTLRLEQTALKAVTASNSYLRFDCTRATMNAHGFEGIELDGARVDIVGEVAFVAGTKVVWRNSSLVREYEALVRDRAGQPARGVQVHLEDPAGALTAHTTDQGGVLRFTIRFDDTNYTKTWTIVVPGGATATRVPVALLTSTPIEIRLP